MASWKIKTLLGFLVATKKPNGGRPSQEYYITLDMAKQLAMVENNEKGMQVRKYFIECEKKLTTNLSKLSILMMTLFVLLWTTLIILCLSQKT